MYLGIEHQSGLMYEGIDGAELPAIPTPIVTQAKLIEAQADWGKQLARRARAASDVVGVPRGYL
jgi:hypothetical protein